VCINFRGLGLLSETIFQMAMLVYLSGNWFCLLYLYKPLRHVRASFTIRLVPYECVVSLVGPLSPQEGDQIVRGALLWRLLPT
jgi:hypothetical protein